MAVTPGFLRSESMLQRLGVTEDNWRDAGKQDSNFLQSESPLFVGRTIAALAADPKVRLAPECSSARGSWPGLRVSTTTAGVPDWGRHRDRLLHTCRSQRRSRSVPYRALNWRAMVDDAGGADDNVPDQIPS